MTNERLTTLVDELDRLVPREGAVIWERYGLYGSEYGEPGFCGNRLGYLRLGIELLRIADAPHQPDNPTRVAADLTYLVNIDRLQGEVAVFERREISAPELVAARQPPGHVSKALERVVIGFVFGSVAVIVLIALVLGIIQIVRFLGT